MKSKYLKFKLAGRTKATAIYNVLSKGDNCLLGKIKWYASWRQYAFLPAPNTVFTKTCNEDINRFITILMTERKSKSKHSKSRSKL